MPPINRAAGDAWLRAIAPKHGALIGFDYPPKTKPRRAGPSLTDREKAATSVVEQDVRDDSGRDGNQDVAAIRATHPAVARRWRCQVVMAIVVHIDALF